MPVNPLPPQAYTKDTLQKAYTWLLEQNSSVKEMVTSNEILISLYLKAQRDGDAALETPSIQNFKQELKSLAHLMGDLQQPAPTQSPSLQASFGLQGQAHNFAGTSLSNGVVANGHLTNGARQQSQSSANGQDNILKQLDSVSLKALEDVRTTLNLSSDAEALRALIALGHKHFRKIHS